MNIPVIAKYLELFAARTADDGNNYKYFLFGRKGVLSFDESKKYIEALIKGEVKTLSDAKRLLKEQFGTSLFDSLDDEEYLKFLDILHLPAEYMEKAYSQMLPSQSDYASHITTLLSESGFSLDEPQQITIRAQFEAMKALGVLIENGRITIHKELERFRSEVSQLATKLRNGVDVANSFYKALVLITGPINYGKIHRMELLNVELPVFIPMRLLDLASKGKTTLSPDIRYVLPERIPPSTEPYEMTLLSTEGVSDKIASAILSSGNWIQEHPCNIVIAARAFSTLKYVSDKGFQELQPMALPYLTRPIELSEGIGESKEPVKGGGKKRKKKPKKPKKKRKMIGGGSEDAVSIRAGINASFARSFFKLLGQMADSLKSLTSNNTRALMEFFSDNTTNTLVKAIQDINIPSRGYIPTLSGYYRTSYAEARRTRYIKSLVTLRDQIKKFAVPSYKMDKSLINAFSRISAIAMDMKRVIEEANRKMKDALAKLAAGEIKALTEKDSPMADGVGLDTKEPEAEETGGYMGIEHKRLRSAIDNLTLITKRSASKNTITKSLAKLEDYIKNGPKFCRAAVEERMSKLKAEYDRLIANLPVDKREDARRIVDMKLDSLKEFYDRMIELEKYLSQAHVSLIKDPGVREQLYEALGKWTLMVKGSEGLKSKFKREMERFASHLSEMHAVTPAGDGKGSTEIKNVNKDIINHFKTDFSRVFSQSPDLKLVFHLVNILEKSLKRGFDVKKFYDSAIRYIQASAIDLCNKNDIIKADDVKKENLTEQRSYVVYKDGDKPTVNDEETIGVANGISTDASKDIGIYFRHALSKKRFEDELFVRWMKSIVALLLLALDRDRVVHGRNRLYQPGSERLMIGGGIDSPLGITGTTKVIPDASPLYHHVRAGIYPLTKYFQWANDNKEPQLVINFPRSSRFYLLNELLTSSAMNSDLSDSFGAKYLAMCNELWEDFASTEPDPDKRCNAIAEEFINEAQRYLVLQTKLEYETLKIAKEEEKEVRDLTGVSDTYNAVTPISELKDKTKYLRHSVFEALRKIALSVFDIASKINISEEHVANDYREYVRRSKERLAALPESERFSEFMKMLRSPDESIGDVQTLFMAFVEFVLTPLFLTIGLVEGFVYRMGNLYIMIVRYLLSALVRVNIKVGSVKKGVNISFANTDTPEIINLWHYFEVWDNKGPFEKDESFADRVDRLIEYIKEGEFKTPDRTKHLTPNGFDINGTTRPGLGSNELLGNLRGLYHHGEGLYGVHMRQPIYKALQAVLLFDDLIKVKAETKRGLTIEAKEFTNEVVTGMDMIKEMLGVFMQIGEREHTNKYFRDISKWDVKGLLNEVINRTNKACAILSHNYWALGEYIPNAVCYDSGAKNWVVNYRRALIKNDEDGKLAVAFHSTIHNIMGGIYEWSNIRVTGETNVTSITGTDWTELDTYYGMFNPTITVSGKRGPATGFMPWSRSDTRVIESGWTEDPVEVPVLTGMGLNSPALNSGNYEKAIGIGYRVLDGANSAVRTELGKKSALEIGFKANNEDNTGLIIPFKTDKVVMSDLFALPAYESRVEVFNRLLAKMAITLSINGEKQVILQELAQLVVEHSDLAEFFEEKVSILDIGRISGKQMALPFLVQTIPTPRKISLDTYVMYTKNGLVAISPGGKEILSYMDDIDKEIKKLELIILEIDKFVTVTWKANATDIITDADSLKFLNLLSGETKADANIPGLSGDPTVDGISSYINSVSNAIERFGTWLSKYLAEELKDGKALDDYKDAADAINKQFKEIKDYKAYSIDRAKADDRDYTNNEKEAKKAYKRLFSVLFKLPRNLGDQIGTTGKTWTELINALSNAAEAASVRPTFKDAIGALKPGVLARDNASPSAMLSLLRVFLALKTKNIVNRDIRKLQVKEVLILPSALTTGARGKGAPSYMENTFIYDVVLYPFLHSLGPQGSVRLNELSDTDAAKYIATIPHFITCFKHLLKLTELDNDLGLLDQSAKDIDIMGIPITIAKNAAATDENEKIEFKALLSDQPAEIKHIPTKFKRTLQAFIECLATIYDKVRVKYGNPVYMEPAKGDFSPYYTNGKFDVTKLTTPLSMLIGTTLVGKKGPAIVASFGTRGCSRMRDALLLSCFAPTIHKELHNYQLVPLESFPWTVALAERLEKVTTASITKLLQSAINYTGRLAMYMNAMNLQTLCCHSPYASHTYPSLIFHPHSIDITLASMIAGMDLVAPSYDTYSFTIKIPSNTSIKDPKTLITQNNLIVAIYHKDSYEGDVDKLLGRWARPPLPLLRHMNLLAKKDKLIWLSYTVTPYKIETSSTKERCYATSKERTSKDKYQKDSFDGEETVLPLKLYRLTKNDNGLYEEPKTANELIANALKTLKAHPVDSKILQGQETKLIVLLPSLNKYSSIEKKESTKWYMNKTKANVIIEQQLGYPKEQPSDGAVVDPNYYEMVQYAPPKGRWGTITPDERRTLGFYASIRRNPISPISLINMVPFSQIYTFSEAFDMYFQINSTKNSTEKGANYIYSRIPSLLLEPLEVKGKYKKWQRVNNRIQEEAKHTIILNEVDPALIKGEEYKSKDLTKRKIYELKDAVKYGGQDVNIAWQSYKPPESSIEDFYKTAVVHKGNKIYFCAPSNEACSGGYSLASFPLFAMYIRMLDQYGIRLKEEVAACLKEIKYDSETSLSTEQLALLNIL